MTAPRASNTNTILAYKDAPTLKIEAGGVTYAYRELGPKGGIPVVFFVHLAATLDNWDPRIVDPIAKNRHVITLDSAVSVPRPVTTSAADSQRLRHQPQRGSAREADQYERSISHVNQSVAEL